MLNKSTKEALKKFLIMISGSIVGVVLKLVIDDKLNYKLLILFIVLFSICSLYGFDILEFLKTKYEISFRRITTFWLRRIAILNDIEWNSENEGISSWSNISSRRWCEVVRAKTYGIPIQKKYINISNDKNAYYAIINPYGGLYPEVDSVEKISLKSIFDYVANGGIFVNVADVPGFWTYDPFLNTKTKTAPYQIINNSPHIIYSSCPFVEKLGLQITDPKIDDQNNWIISSKISNYFEGNIPKKVDRFAIINTVYPQLCWGDS